MKSKKIHFVYGTKNDLKLQKKKWISMIKNLTLLFNEKNNHL